MEQIQNNKKKNGAGLAVLIIILVATLGFVSYSFFFEDSNLNSVSEKIDSSKNEASFANVFSFGSDTKKIKAPNSDYIAKIYITGVIQEANKTYNQKWLLETIDSLEKDSHNKGIILFINSPGGTVYEADEVYLALAKYQKTRKPVWAYQGQLAASGGYYISCAADYILANRNTLTGSIGVIAGQSIDMTELMAKIGIKSETFTAGKNKNMLNYNSPLTEEQKNIMLSVAGECYEQFTNIVCMSRGISNEKIKEIADGRIYTANQALKLNLIDKICSFDEAVQLMKAQNKLSDAQVIDYKYSPKQTFFEMLSNSLSSVKPLTQTTEGRVLDMISCDLKYPAYLYK